MDDIERARELYARAMVLVSAKEFPGAAAAAKTIVNNICVATEATGTVIPCQPIIDAFYTSVRDLYAAEQFDKPPRHFIDAQARGIEGARLRDSLNMLILRHESWDGTFSTFQHICISIFIPYLRALPKYAHMTGTPTHALTIPLIDGLKELPQLLENMIGGVVGHREREELRLFEGLCNNLFENSRRASQREFRTESDVVLPTKSRLPPSELVKAFLGATPLTGLFEVQVPFEIPQDIRFEHTWVCSGTGHGKTNWLTYQVMNDLDEVAAGQASVFLMDSQGGLIPSLIRHPDFARGGRLEGRLVLLDATDIEWPLAVNIFDIKQERIKTYSPFKREQLLNSTVDILEYLMGSILDADLTNKQGTMFKFALRLLLEHVPGATIHTFRELFEEDGLERFAPYVANTDKTARAFFAREFTGSEFKKTRPQITRRLYGILANRSLERMLSSPYSKVDLFDELNQGKVVVVDARKSLLQPEGTEIFGRFWLCKLAQAAIERDVVGEKMPTYCYIDEAHDYCSKDPKIQLILEQARKQSIGLTLLHQNRSQMPGVLDALDANTSTKMVGGTYADARAFAALMRTTPEFVDRQPKGSFATYVKGLTDAAVSLKVPLIGRMPQMTERQFDELRHEQRMKYATHYSQLEDEDELTVSAPTPEPTHRPTPLPPYRGPTGAPGMKPDDDHSTPKRWLKYWL